MIENLNDDNFIIYALKCYNSPHYIMSEFNSDIKRLKYLKRLFKKYKAKKILKERLILNHIILLNNVFGPLPTSRLLFYSVDKCHYSILKTFLCYLHIMPDEVRGIKGQNIYTTDIPLDVEVLEILRNI